MSKPVLLATVLMLLLAGSVLAEPIGLAVVSAKVETDIISGAPTVEIVFAPEAQQTIAKFTSRHVGEIANLIVDGTVVSSPRIQTPILGPAMVIAGAFTASQAAALARRISSGEALVAVELAPD